MRRFLPALIGLSALLGAPFAFAQSSGWTQLQGGAEHAGAADGPPPPYRVGWDTEAGESGHRGASGPVVLDGVAYAVGRDDVVAVEADTGRTLWTVARAPGLPVTPAITSDGATLVYPEGSGDTAAVVGLGLDDRAVRWRYTPDDDVRAAPAVDGDAVYVGTRAGSVVALDSATGVERWSFNADGVVRSPIAVSGGLVYAVSSDIDALEMTLYALRAADGSEEWRFRPEGAALRIYASGAAVADGRVYIGFDDGDVRALDAREGRLLWSRTVQLGAAFAPGTTPAIADGDVVVASAGGVVARIDGETGEERWRFRLALGVLDGPPLVVGGHVLAGRFDGVLTAIELETGRKSWELDLGGSIGSLAPAGDRVLAGVVAAEGGLIALEADPEGALTSIESPSVLHPDRAVLNYAAAFAAVAAGIVLGFRLLPHGSPSAASAGGAAGGAHSPGGDRDGPGEPSEDSADPADPGDSEGSEGSGGDLRGAAAADDDDGPDRDGGAGGDDEGPSRPGAGYR